MKICLNMIVKDEAKVILRCLNSVLAKVTPDYVVISDTGSTDNTVKVIQDYLSDKGLNFIVLSQPWVNFAHNRTEAFKAAVFTVSNNGRALGKLLDCYALFIDADEELHSFDKTSLEELTRSAEVVRGVVKYNSLAYERVMLAKLTLDGFYESVLHEYFRAKGEYKELSASSEVLSIKVNPDGARSTDNKKYEKDIAVLGEALLYLPKDQQHLKPRYTYYLAQSYRDSGDLARAANYYYGRASMGGFEEEAWHAQYQYALLQRKVQDKIYWLMRAYERRPSRIEPLVHLTRILNQQKLYKSAYALKDKLLQLAHAKTTDVLFVETSHYDWEAYDELALSAYYAERSYDFALHLWEQIKNKVPQSQKARIEDNILWAKKSLYN